MIKIAFDEEAGVWFIASSSVPGLSGEAPTQAALKKRIPKLLADLARANRPVVKVVKAKPHSDKISRVA
jgi:hypothetical protein